MAGRRVYPERRYTAPLTEIENSENTDKTRKDEEVKPLPKRRDTMGKLLVLTEEETKEQKHRQRREQLPHDSHMAEGEGQMTSHSEPLRSQSVPDEHASILKV